MSRQEHQQLELLYQSNAFGDISDWLNLSPQELRSKCLSLLDHWSSVLHWNLNLVTVEGMIQFLEEKWVEQPV